MYWENLSWFDFFNHIIDLLPIHVSGRMKLMKLDIEMIQPVMHDSVFDIFFTEGFTHTVNEVTA